MKAKEEFRELNFEEYLRNIGQLETIKIGEMDVPEFEHNFEKPFLDTFDTLNFLVGKPENDFSKQLKIASATFWNQFGELTHKQMEYVVNSLMVICDVIDDYWTNIDGMRVDSGVWRGRSIMSDVTVFIELDDIKGFKLTIIGMNKFMNKIAST